MIWLTWRQFRAQALTAGVGLALFAAFLVFLGLRTRSAYDDNIVGCGSPADCSSAAEFFQDQFSTQITLASVLLLVIPVLIGIFWGAPLIARELETGTHRFVWNQSITRTRWLLVKLSFIALTAMAVTGLCSALLTWAASRYDLVLGERFGILFFGSRNIVPVGYALFAFILATLTGMLMRRIVPAMAVSLGIIAVLGIAVPLFVRPYLQPPIEKTVNFTVDSVRGAKLNVADKIQVGYSLDNAWVLDSWYPVYDKNGKEIATKDVQECITGDREKDAQCISERDVHFTAVYQPGDRYWTFQWLELGAYVALALILAAVSLGRIRRPLA
ncbi:ABC transporter permease subunit [Micromonospora robiginosa]|uniref:ABC transporter permease subunit n=1 Tax=Micromonospora robiginosa TaxID=2749844 RepID=A0A7L6B3K2_9ACTN|nr:ABC transporter permease subunit [Micromonospora ferruginea]QLQ36506.1 ABC transporter permease subunit [Micromonospora ferruginea]